MDFSPLRPFVFLVGCAMALYAFLWLTEFPLVNPAHAQIDCAIKRSVGRADVVTCSVETDSYRDKNVCWDTHLECASNRIVWAKSCQRVRSGDPQQFDVPWSGFETVSSSRPMSRSQLLTACGGEAAAARAGRYISIK
jgi:hypothetical protein